jgi:hypothetical protein
MFNSDVLKIIVPGLFAFAGAILGAMMTYVAQRRAMHMEREKLAHAARERVNGLSVAVFRDFLSVCKQTERLAERREAGEALDDDEITATTSLMWLRWEEVIVFCDAEIEQHARALVKELQHLAWHTPGADTVTKQLNTRKRELFQVAARTFQVQ